MPPSPAERSRADTRWRVVLVRVDAAARTLVEAALPSGVSLRQEELPRVIRITGDRIRATETARRLREAGAVVLVTEEPAGGESAFCSDHQGRMAGRACVGCGRPVCSACSREGGGEDVCVGCRRKGRSPRARVRRRQLFVLFLFAVFVYQVVEYIRSDRLAVDPRGPVRVAIFQFVPPDEPFAPVVRELNRLPGTGQAQTSLYDIAPWFNGERARYGGPRDYLQVDVFGPWGRVVEPPELDDPELPMWRLPLRALAYARYFRQLVIDQGQSPDDYAARVYVIYSRDTDDLAAHSRGSEQGHVAIVYVDLDEQNTGYAALTVAHELAHTLGGEDLYDPDTSLAMHPEGFVEPFSDPLYPQRFAELMAADVPTGAGREREVRSLEEVRVGYASARAMGWIAPGLAEVYYTPSEVTPAERLEQSAASAPGGPDPAVDGHGAE